MQTPLHWTSPALQLNWQLEPGGEVPEVPPVQTLPEAHLHWPAEQFEQVELALQ